MPQIQENNQSENRFRLSPNLLRESLGQETPVKSGVIKIAKIAIVAVQAATLLVVLLNAKTDFDIKSLKIKVEDAGHKISANTQTQAEIAEIAGRLDYYKKLQNNRILLYNFVEFATSNIPKTIIPVVIGFEDKTVSMVVEATNPIDFALLTNAYLESGKISAITIKSAYLQASKNNFVIDFDAGFK